MKHWTAFIFSLLLALGFATTASASRPEPEHADAAWQATYFNNMDLTGPPVLQRPEAAIHYDWGTGSPGPGVNADGFSVRWTRYIDANAAVYRFATTADDGIRVFVDGGLVLNAWRTGPAQTHSADVTLSTGHHLLVVEYFEFAGPASAHLTISPDVFASIQNWRGEYYNNTDLSGTPTFVRDDVNIDFRWGEGAPAPGINADRFSVRWTRNLNLPAGTYWFTLRIDDGARLWVNDHLLIDSWKDQPVTVYANSIWLPGGAVPVKLEYYERTGGAFATLSWSTSSQEPVITDWRGEYYNNTSPNGTPALVRNDRDVNFDWGTGSPAPGTINADNFSVRWTRNLNLPAGTYRFMMTMDDGCRLWVNGTLLMDDWSDQAANTHGADIWLPGGNVPVKFEYYERGDRAVAKLWWYTVSSAPTITDWRGEYYNNVSLSGSPALVRNDSGINFDWGAGSPDPAISADNFSVRWTRNLNLPTGWYRFDLTTDDGVRLWVADRLVLDDWLDQAAITLSVVAYVPGGSTPVRMEYFEHLGRAAAKLSWTPAPAPESNPPPDTVLLDDVSPDFRWGGLSRTMYQANYGWGGGLYWTYNDDFARSGYNWGAWYPKLAAGSYEVFAHIPAQSGATTSAQYWVSHASGKTLRIVDQNGSDARWESLGTYRFQGSADDYVSLSDVTYEPFLSHKVVWDAMKFERR